MRGGAPLCLQGGEELAHRVHSGPPGPGHSDAPVAAHPNHLGHDRGEPSPPLRHVEVYHPSPGAGKECPRRRSI